MSAGPLRKSLFVVVCFILCTTFSSAYSAGLATALATEPAKQQPVDNKFNQQTYEIGQMVQALQIAIKSPEQQESLLIIINYGSDKRYYSMIRGWLFETLVTVESRLYESQNITQQNKLQLKSDALKKAIRLINTD